MKSPTADFETIDAYIASFPDDVARKLEKVRAAIRKAAPEATEKISYRMPAFHHHGSLVWFAAFKNHIGLYPTASGIRQFESELKGYVHSKGAIQLPLDEALPLALIAKIVKFRVAENEAKSSKKRSAKAR